MSVLPGIRWALVDWMVQHRPVDHVDVPLPTIMSRGRDDAAGAVECWTLGEVVHALWDDPSPAPRPATVLLGLPAGAPYARVVRRLAQARAGEDDPGSWHEAVLRVACRPLRGVAGRHVGAPSAASDGDRASTPRCAGVEADS